MKAAGAVRKPLIDKRLRNVLFSVALCSALMATYYVAVGRESVPTDTHLVWRGPDGRLEIDSGGGVVATQDGKPQRYQISGFALRRMLRALHRQGFMDQDAARFTSGGCLLSLQQAARKTALAYDCEHAPPAIASGVAAVERAIKSRHILNNNN